LVAKGEGSIAERIIKLAKENNIPIVEDTDLVNAMINMEVYEEIPPELYRAIAQILAVQGNSSDPRICKTYQEKSVNIFYIM